MIRLANMIDHTLLKADASENDIVKLCKEAVDHHFFSVCIHPLWVKTAKERLQASRVKVCTVIGFPLGATTSDVKAYETRQAIANGADEVDMVINIGALKSADFATVENDIRAVVNACQGNALVKAIIETSLLTNEQKVNACELAVKAGADFVKTATGFANGGANVADIILMRKTVGSRIGVKASGGIRNRETAEAMVEAGADRIGASASMAIIK